MEAFIIMLKNVIVFVALAVPGYVLVKTKLLKSEQSTVLSTLLTYVGMPFLVFSNTLGLSFNPDTVVSLLTAALVAVACIVVLFFVTGVLTKQEKNAQTRGMMRFSSMFSNNAFLGLPLAIAVFGAQSKAVSLLIVFNIITNVFMFTLGIYLVSGDKNAINLKKVLLNPSLLGFFLGIAFNLLGVKNYVPEISTYGTYMSNLVTPVSMTILGMKMGGVHLPSLFTSKRTYYVSLLRLIVFPVFIVAILLALKTVFPSGPIDEALLLACFIVCATPTPSSSSAFADQFGGDAENAVAFTLSTTIFSVATIPFLYFLLCLFL